MCAQSIHAMVTTGFEFEGYRIAHGGARKGAGRKPSSEPPERHTVTLYKKDLKALRKLDLNLSRAIRKLIAAKAK